LNTLLKAGDQALYLIARNTTEDKGASGNGSVAGNGNPFFITFQYKIFKESPLLLRTLKGVGDPTFNKALYLVLEVRFSVTVAQEGGEATFMRQGFYPY
jgi:hypothetical protein